MTYEITLDLLSGLPNPSWCLDAAQARRLARWLDDSAPTAEVVPDPGLGYRGLLVAADASGEADPTRVFREVVHSPSGGLADPGRALERWLVETGAIAPTLLDVVRLDFETTGHPGPALDR